MENTRRRNRDMVAQRKVDSKMVWLQMTLACPVLVNVGALMLPDRVMLKSGRINGCVIKKSALLSSFCTANNCPTLIIQIRTYPIEPCSAIAWKEIQLLRRLAAAIWEPAAGKCSGECLFVQWAKTSRTTPQRQLPVALA